MADNFYDNNNGNNKHISIIKSSKYESSPLKFDTIIIIVNKVLKELLQELNVILLNTEFEEKNYNTHKFNLLIGTLLLEYDLDLKNVLKIMTNNPKNIMCCSSLIGYFYQHGIGCKVDEIKAFEIFSNVIKNNQNVLLDQVPFIDQKNETIIFLDNDIKELNEIIAQYFISIFLYENTIFHRKNNYKFHIRNAEKGDNVSQHYIVGGNIKAMFDLGFCYECGCGVISNRKKAFELYLKSAEGGMDNKYKAFKFYLLKAAEKGHANYYHDGKIISKDEEKWFYWNRKAAINGYALTQYILAEYYITDYINKNESRAFKWYMKLAYKNWLIAICMVAKCYRDGIGTDKNLEEATKWIKYYRLSGLGNKPQITLNEF
ncbi:kinase-like domain-containing protein [Rhizophagus clarus]|uniref:Kinase-like domain-containing protein n=1 Tax=Rhizophagus clarus TaxID=94130 RepID=A0A8H3R365_9GLOM|nr:kinase-like domain-containing protein [Rhizophagus clarus]